MIEHRQSQLAKNAEAIEAWTSKLLRAAHALEKLRAQRKRLLKGPGGKLKTRGDFPLGAAGGGAVEGLDDEVGVL